MSEQHIPPPWERPGASSEPALNTDALPKNDTRWKPGKSANPAGRPKGIPDRRRLMANVFAGDYDAIVKAVVDAAKDGDMQAASLYLSRVEPPLRPKAERVTFSLDTTKPLAAQAAQVIQAAADGEISSDDAQVFLQCLGTYANLVQADSIEARLAALEGKAKASTRTPIGAGMVVVDVDERGNIQ